MGLGCDIIQAHKAPFHCLPSNSDKETMEYITSLCVNTHGSICNISGVRLLTLTRQWKSAGLAAWHTGVSVLFARSMHNLGPLV